MALPREGVVKKEKKAELMQLLNRIFKNRIEAEFAFDIVGVTFSSLKIGNHGDIYFPVEFSQKSPGFQFVFPSREIPLLGFEKSKFNQSCMMEIILEASTDNFYTEYLYHKFDKYDKDPDVRIYKMPIDVAIFEKDKIIKNYKNVLENFVSTRKEPIPFRKNPEKEIDQRAIRDIFFQTLSDSKDQDELISGIQEDRFQRQPEYSIEQLSSDSGFDINRLRRWINAINRKGQLVFYGPPGTGKTYMAENLANHLISGGDGFVEIVQFHPAFAYEDFIMGIRPQTREDGILEYPLVPGRFIEFCTKARQRKDLCVIIIDEINRADLAKVFGELLYLLEFSVNGRRKREIPLAGGKNFAIPNNVRIIGTMNTADRSIALVDHALRRRFAFIHLGPNYEILHEYHKKNNTGFPVDKLIGVLKQLNDRISDPHYELGISFFLSKNIANEIEDIWIQEVEPFLEEYYFDHLEYVEDFRWESVRGKIQ